MDFRVSLDIFRGPLDLLLYLVRKHEVEIVDIPIAMITDQYLEYLSVLRELDVNSVGDFLAMASTLVEDPRKELVERLLEYKKYRDAASILEERSRSWQQHYPRVADDLPPRRRDLAEEPIREVELWDLVSAFGRIIRDNESTKPSSIVYDETPIHVYMARIFARLQQEERLSFYDFFEPAMHKSSAIGVFLAILELVRHRRIQVEQRKIFGQIWLRPRHDAEPLDFSKIDNYDYETSAAD